MSRNYFSNKKTYPRGGGKKQEEFCRWLIEEDIGLTKARRQLFIYYLFKYRLIQNPAVELKRKLYFGPEDYDWLFDDDLLNSVTEQEQARFLQRIHKKLLGAETPLEASQKLLGVDSPIELALKVIQTEEQLNEFLSRIQQTSYQPVSSTTQQAAASA